MTSKRESLSTRTRFAGLRVEKDRAAHRAHSGTLRSQIPDQNKAWGVPTLDNPALHGIINAQKGAAHGGQPKERLNRLLAARVAAGRLTHIRGYVHRDQKDQDEAYQKTKEYPPPLFPHAHHPLCQGVANRLCMYSAPFAGSDPVAPCGVGRIIDCVSCFVNSLPILTDGRLFCFGIHDSDFVRICGRELCEAFLPNHSVRLKKGKTAP